MANYYGNQPQSISTFLSERAEKAMAEIAAMTKRDLAYDITDFANAIITRHQVKPLELGQHKATIPESNPKQVDVVWPFSGDKQVVSLYDANGQYIQPTKISSQQVKEVFTYYSPIAANEHNQAEAKKDIEKAATAFKAHFSRLNAKIEEHNRLLEERVPNSVKLKYDALNKLKAAEDFLN